MCRLRFGFNVSKKDIKGTNIAIFIEYFNLVFSSYLWQFMNWSLERRLVLLPEQTNESVFKQFFHYHSQSHDYSVFGTFLLLVLFSIFFLMFILFWSNCFCFFPASVKNVQIRNLQLLPKNARIKVLPWKNQTVTMSMFNYWANCWHNDSQYFQ